VVQKTKALRDHYRQVNISALQSFDAKVHEWIKTPPESYIGFVGELHVADWLRQKGVLHRFIQSSPRPPRTPDIELTIKDMQAYLEVRTMQENPYMQFAEGVAEKIALVSPGCSVMPLKVKPAKGKEVEDLVAAAVEKIKAAWPDRLYNPIEHKGKEGEEFSLVFRPGGTSDPRQPSMVWHWPETRDWRKRDEKYVYVPWLDSALTYVLKEKIEQFKTYKPTFLVWVSYDEALPDFKTSVSRVLEQQGQAESVDVAGVIVFHPYSTWDLTENPSCPSHRELKEVGLFDAINALRGNSP
jgi:hypothetical protein